MCEKVYLIKLNYQKNRCDYVHGLTVSDVRVPMGVGGQNATQSSNPDAVVGADADKNTIK